ncbi:MAG: 3-isopropylmalate dehydratase small subunit [Gammaproteobacteria bacterium]|jgi:3-isopropylmalate/(R)-2-methylmalate dehydratase small subunit|nr:3-isopropylmalate dehydratase small subunit [Gammaproteobacteria bacterium]MBT5202907.1 3-isopropylmalate dehydratase small subunit [Gammaproteobacteria bacterium]MBT5602399.1 3-isopropylmalate dehydratase small subunit [Gammaproteobacteria bacterium]MBT6245187.1 3-isopropylmalate dehydratase small subunit [Gammaproteobacteria bacterium]
MSTLTKMAGRGVYVQGNDIDTDRIIPARYLKCVTFDELGPGLFRDERFHDSGESKGHVLDMPAYQGAEFLISDANFGCGSSREHAPQAIQKFGFKAVIAESFAEIFHGNCTTLGIPCLIMAKEARSELVKLVQENPQEELFFDIETLQISLLNQSFEFTMKESVREAFLSSSYDPLDELLRNAGAVSNVAASLGYG